MNAPFWIFILVIVPALAAWLGVVNTVWSLVGRFRRRKMGARVWHRIRPHSLPERLLLYVWSYPETAGTQTSWAVKESQVLRGLLDSARERPGLGVAILSTELALDFFSAQGRDKVQASIQWAIERVGEHHPHLLPGVVHDSVVSSETSIPDFRHTLALAVVLARSKTFYCYLDGYVQMVLEVQREDGGWDPGGGTTVSEVFTVFYAIELLHLCADDPHFVADVRREFELARDGGLKWLIEKQKPAGLWKSGVLTEFTWDDLLTTAWVLNRLSPISSASVPKWAACVERALTILVQRATEATCWIYSGTDERNRVEARIGAAVAKTAANHELPESTASLVDAYIGDWRRRAASWAAILPDANLDLATAIFLLRGLYDHGELLDYANRILVASEPGNC